MKKLPRAFYLGPAWAMALGLLASAFAQPPPANSASAPSPTRTPQPAPAQDTNPLSSPHPSMTNDNVKSGDKHFLKKTAESGQLEVALAELAVQQAADPEVREFARQLAAERRQMCDQLEQLAAKKGQLDQVAEYSVTMPLDGVTPATSAPAPATTHQPAAARAPGAADKTKKTAGNTDAKKTGTLRGNTAEYDSGAATSQPSASVTPELPTGSPSAGKGAEWASTNRVGQTEWNNPKLDRHYKSLADKEGAGFDKQFIATMVSDYGDDVARFEKEAANGSDVEVKAFAAAGLPKLRERMARAQQIEKRLKSS